MDETQYSTQYMIIYFQKNFFYINHHIASLVFKLVHTKAQTQRFGSLLHGKVARCFPVRRQLTGRQMAGGQLASGHFLASNFF